MAGKKSEKKFIKHHLPALLKKRKETAKLRKGKQDRVARKENRLMKAQRAAATGKRPAYIAETDFDLGFETKDAPAPIKKEKKPRMDEEEEQQDMSVDDFLQGGFEEFMGSDDEGSDEGSDIELSDEEEKPKKKAAVSKKVEPVKKELSKKEKKAAAEAEKKAKESASAKKVEVGQKRKADSEKEEKKPVNKKEEAKKMKEQLGGLEGEDPEFYQFLKSSDPALLEFGGDDDDIDMEEEDELSEDDEMDTEEGADKKKKPKQKKRVREDLTEEMLEEWENAVDKETNMKVIKKFVVAFRAAAHTGDEGQLDTAENTKGEQGKFFPFRVSDSNVFNRLMLFCLRNMHVLFDELLDRKENVAEDVSPAKSKRWKPVATLARAYIASLQHFLSQLSQPDMVAVVLRQVGRLAPYFGCFEGAAKKMLKNLLTSWGSNEHKVRVLSYIAIRRFAKCCPFPFIEQCMKGIYLTYVKNAKFVNATTLPVITFMANCVCDLFSLDAVSAYQHGFIYIRQLAIHLRNALNTHTKDAFSAVYNWQFVNCLRVWSRFLTLEANNTEIKPLVYPFIQVCLGVMKVLPTAQYIPLRFTIVRFVTEVAQASHLFVPLAPYLLEIFDMAALNRKPKPSSSKPHDIELVLRVGKKELDTKEFQERAIDVALNLLVQYFAAYAEHISYPELCLPALITLRKYVKGCKIARVAKQVTTIIKKLEENAAYITRHRSSVEFSPKDIKQATEFSSSRKGEAPLLQYAEQQRKQEEAIKARMATALDSHRHPEDHSDSSGDESVDDSSDAPDSGDEDGGSDDGDMMSDTGADSDADSDADSEEEEKPKKKFVPKPKNPHIKNFEADGLKSLKAGEADTVEDYKMSDSEDDGDNSNSTRATKSKAKKQKKHSSSGKPTRR